VRTTNARTPPAQGHTPPATTHLQLLHFTENALNTYLYRHLYNTSGKEQDADTVPYCDWMFARGFDETTGVWSNPVAGKTACSDFEFVVCDSQGNIVELILNNHAFTGTIPASIASLTFLKKLELGYNQFTGEVPTAVFDSEFLEDIILAHNHFTGEFPCMTHPEPKLKQIDFRQNYFTGSLKACLFTNSPALTEMYISYNRLNSSIPPEIKEATELKDFIARHSGLTGELPLDMMCLKKLFYFIVPRNKLAGSLEQVVVNGWKAIYQLDLASNSFSGQLPTFDWHTPSLRYLYLSDNHFTTPFEAALAGLQDEQVSTSGSSLVLDGNRLTGPLPDLFYRLLTDAHGVTGFSATRNFMLCDPDTGEWPDWVFRFGTSYFGECTRLATPTAAADIVLGQYVTVTGQYFLPSDELKCKVGDTTLAASFVSTTAALCGPIPDDGTFTPGQSYFITVANYGSDFYSAELGGSSYAAVTTTFPLSPSPPPPSPPPPASNVDGTENNISNEDDDDLPAGAIAGIAIACVVSAALFVVVCIMYQKERAGTPMFAALEPPSGGGGGKEMASIEVTSTNDAAPPESKA